MRWAVVLAVVLLLAPLVASAEICRSTGSFAWPSVGGAPAGAWTGCTPSAGDDFVVRSGHTVTLTGSILQDGVTQATGITVNAGGTLLARVTPQTGPFTLALNEGHVVGDLPTYLYGLRCFGVCDLRGGYREAPGADHSRTPGPLASLPVRPWLTPAVVPCAGWNGVAWVADCAGSAAVPGSRNRIGLVYDSAPAAGTPPFLAEALSQLDATTDFLMFYDADPEDGHVPAEVNLAYEIASVHTGVAGPTPIIQIDVRQGALDPPEFPLARRAILYGPLQAPVGVGQRNLELPAGTLDDAWDPKGRWLVFSDGAGRTLQRPYMILRVVNGATACEGASPCDQLLIGDPRGFEQAAPAGREVYIGYGMQTGDAFYVAAPVRVTSATSARGDSGVFLTGAASRFESVWFDGIKRILGLELNGLTVTNAWFRDPTPNGSGGDAVRNAIYVHSSNDAILGPRLTISGGDDRGNQCGPARNQPCGRYTAMHHGVTGYSNTAALEWGNDNAVVDVSVRYHGDRCFRDDDHTRDGTPYDFQSRLTLRRLLCQFASDVARQRAAVDLLGSSSVDTLVEDVACIHCTGADQRVLQGHGLAGSAQVRGLLDWGNDGHGYQAVATNLFEDLWIVGGDADATGSLLPAVVRGFVVRDWRGVPGGAGPFLIDSASSVLEDGYFLNVEVAGSLRAALPHAALALRNVAFADVRLSLPVCSASSCAALAWIAGAVSPDLERVLVAYSPGTLATTRRAVDFFGSSPTPQARISGLMIANHAFAGRRPAALNMDILDVPRVQWSAGPCFFGNERDGVAGALVPSAIFGGDAAFVDPAAGRFDTEPGSPADVAGCGVARGVAAPGTRRHRWMHALVKLPPERMADDADGDGVVEDAAAAVCAGGLAVGCSDNCPVVFNPSQRDADGDGIGDACGPCNNGLDDDGDGLVDFPADPGCKDAAWQLEDPACDDDLDNDGDGGVDWDGDPHGLGAGPVLPDRDCSGRPWRDREHKGGCGLGFELIGLAFALRGLAARRGRAGRA